MMNGIGNNFVIKGQVESPYYNSSFMKTNKMNDTNTKSSFTDVLGDITNSVNKDLNEPDKLLTSAMNGDSNVDIHDITTAMAKAEMTVTVATQITTKIINAYERISQINV